MVVAVGEGGLYLSGQEKRSLVGGCCRKCLCLEGDWTRQLVSQANQPAPGTPVCSTGLATDQGKFRAVIGQEPTISELWVWQRVSVSNLELSVVAEVFPSNATPEANVFLDLTSPPRCCAARVYLQLVRASKTM